MIHKLVKAKLICVRREEIYRNNRRSTGNVNLAKC